MAGAVSCPRSCGRCWGVQALCAGTRCSYLDFGVNSYWHPWFLAEICPWLRYVGRFTGSREQLRDTRMKVHGCIKTWGGKGAPVCKRPEDLPGVNSKPTTEVNKQHPIMLSTMRPLCNRKQIFLLNYCTLLSRAWHVDHRVVAIHGTLREQKYCTGFCQVITSGYIYPFEICIAQPHHCLDPRLISQS